MNYNATLKLIQFSPFMQDTIIYCTKVSYNCILGQLLNIYSKRFNKNKGYVGFGINNQDPARTHCQAVDVSREGHNFILFFFASHHERLTINPHLCYVARMNLRKYP